ncbi:ribonuclease H-like domain-containing protein [Tanacetum coccineum]
MVTRAKAGISKPLARMNCHATTTSPIPRSHLHALRDPNWHKAMVDEYNALISNGTWALVPRPANVNIVRSMWLFKHKFNADGSLSRYKARLVANGRSQQQGIDFDETFSPVVKPATIRTVLSLAVTRDWPIHQLDVKNAFSSCQLSEKSHESTTGFVIRPPRLCLFICKRSLFGLKQAPRAGFQGLLLFVHDRSKFGLFLSQSKFAEEILERHMQHCNPCKTPVDTESNWFRWCPQICLYMHDPRDPHFIALKRILRYVRGTIDHGLQLYVSSTSQLTAYTDADWAGCPVTRRSTSGYCVFLGDNLLSWSAKRQVTLSRSSAEAEYRGVEYVHQRTKHIEIDIHFVREYVASGQVRVLHVPSRFQYADIFTKGLPTALFLEFRSRTFEDLPLTLRGNISLICAKIYDETNIKKSKAHNLEQLVGVTKPLVVDVNNPSVGMPKGYLSANCPYFQEGCDAVGKAGISALVKCTFAIRQLAYVAVPDSLDEYLQIGEKTSRDFLMHFCNGVIDLYGEEYLRRPTRGDSGSEPFILLEAVVSQDLWIWHAFFGVAGSNNDVNVLRQSPVLNDLKVGKAPESISQPGSNDVKRIRYKQAHEAARKDVERAFGVLKKKWTIVKTPARSRSHKRITHLMYTCIILHNMIRKEKGKAISPDFYPEEQHREDDPVRSAQDRLRVIREIHDEETHLNLKADLVEHIWHRTNAN